MSDTQVFKLPDVGEGLTEAEIVVWHVKVGDIVAVNETIVEVETAKSVVELPSPYEGVVMALHADEGLTLPVGSPLISIRPMETEIASEADARDPQEAREGHADAEIQPASTEPPSASADPPLVLVGSGPSEGGVRRVHVQRVDATYGHRPRAIWSAVTDRPQSPEPEGQTRVAVTGVRRAMAEAMVRSAFSAPHATMWTTVDVNASMDLLGRLRRDRGWSGVRATPLLIIARAVSLAVRQFPEINASWDDARQEVVLKRGLNLGVAAATPRGLLVPNIKDACTLSVRELAGALDDLVMRARAGKLTPADMTGGTFTLTNVGTFGVEGATPILNPPEAAIMAVGAIQPRPWVVDGAINVRDVMTLSISIDHRVADGQLGASVLRHVAELLNDPARALL